MHSEESDEEETLRGCLSFDDSYRLWEDHIPFLREVLLRSSHLIEICARQ